MTSELDESQTEPFIGTESACISYDGTPLIFFGEQSDILSRSNAHNTVESESFKQLISSHIQDFKPDLLKSTSHPLTKDKYLSISRKSDQSEFLALIPSTVSTKLSKELLINRGFVHVVARKTIDFDGFLLFPLEVNEVGSRRFIDPAYIYSTTHHLLVGNDGISLNHDNGRKLDFLELKTALEPNTKIRLITNPHTTVSSDFAKIYLESDVLAEREWLDAERKRKSELARLEAQIKQKKIDAENAEFNKSLNIPFNYSLGYKVVLSGLTEGSACNGVKRNTVLHIVLDEDYEEGRLKRHKGDFLCKASSSKMWNETISNSRGRVTCKQCLSAAKRWNNK